MVLVGWMRTMIRRMKNIQLSELDERLDIYCLATGAAVPPEQQQQQYYDPLPTTEEELLPCS